MNLMIAANKSEKKVSSFDLGHSTPSISANEVVELSQKKLSQIELVKQQLVSLNKNDKEQLIYEIFAQDINSIIETEKEKITIKNVKVVEELLTNKTQEFENNNQVVINAKIDELDRMIELFTQQELTILVDNEAHIVGLIFSAVLTLIEESISDPQHIATVLTKLSVQLLGNDKPVLELNSAQFKLLNDTGIEASLLEKFSLIENKELLPCSYKLKLNAGSLEADLNDKLSKFKELLVNTYMYRDNG